MGQVRFFVMVKGRFGAASAVARAGGGEISRGFLDFGPGGGILKEKVPFNSKEGDTMSKSHDVKKETKKAPAKTLKEKRAEKRAKRGE